MMIAVLFGGTSEERDVSIANAAQIIPALRALGHDVFAVDTATGRLPAAAEQSLLSNRVAPSPPSNVEMASVRRRAIAFAPAAANLRKADVVFLASHGGAGEDGRVQAMLDLAGLAYTGSNHIASAAATDKDLAKRLFRSANLPTPDWLMAPVKAQDVEKSLGWPVVVKPSKQGSTVGLALVRQAADLDAAISHAHTFDDEVIIEKFIPGREFTVGILDGATLPVGEIFPPGDVFDYQSKYQVGVAREVFPADLSQIETTLLQDYALRAHRALKLGSYSRIDFRREASGNFWCLEANSLPGMTATSLLPQAAKAAGIEFPDLLDRICKARFTDAPAIMDELQFDPSRQLLAAQCSGTLILAQLGLLEGVAACTDVTTKPWVEAAGVAVLDQPFFARGNVATAGGCLASQYLACWIIARLVGLDAAAGAIHYVAPVGEKEEYVSRALGNIERYLPQDSAAANHLPGERVHAEENRFADGARRDGIALSGTLR